MKSQILPLSLFALGGLAACQVTGPTQDSPPERERAGYSSSSGYATSPTTTRSEVPASASASAASSNTTSAVSRPYQDSPSTRNSNSEWGPGTKNFGVSGHFINDETKDEPSDPGDDIETLEVEATAGVLVTDRIEINLQGSYHESDIGLDDVNRTGLFGGVRYHFVVPTDASGFGVYAEGKAGMLSVDSPARDGEEFAYGASGGVIWFPWGADSGMAIDVSIDWLESDVVDRVGASAGLAYYW